MASKSLQILEDAITWLASGGDHLFTCTSVSAGAGRQGALADLLATARAREYTWIAFVKMATTPVVDDVIRVYWKSADASNAHPDNDDGTGDLDVSSEDKLKNLHYLGDIVIDETSTSPEFKGSGIFEAPAQVGGPVFWNAAEDDFSSTAADCGFEIRAVPYEAQ
jgi:hypothetical protein